MSWMLILAAFGLSLLTSLALVPVAMRMARRLGIMDSPNERKVHRRVTPLLGGLAVYVAALLIQSAGGAMTSKVVVLMAACAVVVVLGIVDDRFDIHSRFRLAVHLLVAFLLALGGFRTEMLPYALDVAVSTLWIAGMVNAINCLDCADGIVGGLSGLTLSSYGLLLAITDHFPLALICFAFAGASIGFLGFNFPPARIFLGDCGSTTIGLVIGAVSLRAVAHADGPVAVGFAFMPALLPAGDLLLVHVRRYLAGMRNLRDLLASTGKDHLPHRLMRLGLGPRGVALVLYGLVALLSLSAVLAPYHRGDAIMLLAGCVYILYRIERAYIAQVIADRLLDEYRSVPSLEDEDSRSNVVMVCHNPALVKK